jgi:flagellar biosynthesis protein FliQ
MENTATPVSTTTTGIRYGLITGLIWMIVDFVFRTTGLSLKYSLYLPASLVVYIVGIIMAHRYFKEQNGGFMSYGQGVMIVVILSLVSGTLSGLFNYVYVNFIDPDYAARMRADMEAWMSSFNGIPDEQIEKTLAGLSDEKVKSPLQIGQTLLSSAFGGLIVGLLISIFTRRNRPEFE